VLREKPQKGAGSFEGRWYEVENGKRKLNAEWSVYYSEDGKTVYESYETKGQKQRVTRRQLDDQRRAVVVEGISRGFFGEKVLFTERMKYYKDTSMETENAA